MAYSIGKLRRVLYSVGNLGYTLPGFFTQTYIFITYAPTSGKVIVPSFLVGVAFFLGTLVQAIANPFIGNMSDKSRSKIGRRKFFIISGLIPFVVFFMLIWFPFLTGISGAVLLSLVFIGYNFFFAYVVAPYLALIPEIAETPNERVRLTTIMAYFSIIGIILASLIPSIFLALHFTIQTIGITMGIIILFSFLLVYFSTEEKKGLKVIPSGYSIKEAFVQTFKNSMFNRFIVAYLAFQFGFYFLLSSIGYIVEDLVFPGNPNFESYVGLFTLVAVLFAMAFSPILVKYTDKFGEKNAFIVFTTILGVSFLSLFVLAFIPLSDRLYTLIAIMIVAGLGLTSYFILPNAILGEVIDQDEKMTGFRREAMYFGIQGLLERIPSSLAGLALGYWISYVYLPTRNPEYIGFLGLISGVTLIITVLLFFRVPLPREGVKKAEEVARQ